VFTVFDFLFIWCSGIFWRKLWTGKCILFFNFKHFIS